MVNLNYNYTLSQRKGSQEEGGGFQNPWTPPPTTTTLGLALDLSLYGVRRQTRSLLRRVPQNMAKVQIFRAVNDPYNAKIPKKNHKKTLCCHCYKVN